MRISLFLVFTCAASSLRLSPDDRSSRAQSLNYIGGPTPPVFRKQFQGLNYISGQTTAVKKWFSENMSQPKHGSAGAVFRNFSEDLHASGFNITTFLDDQGEPQLNSDVTKYLELLMNHRHNSGLKQPGVMQRPVPLESPPNCNTHYFTGPRTLPAHVVMILTLGFELDILEAQLYELNDVVDEFVVFEGLYTHRGAAKPQVFPKARERFSPFLHKIRYYLQLPSEVEFQPPEHAVKGNGWKSWMNENVRKIAYARYVKEENDAGRSLGNTLFINADIDEIPPATGVQRFKYCKTEKLWASFCSVTYMPDFGHIRVYNNSCGQMGRPYWPFPTILREGEPLRNYSFHSYMYDEMPGAHLNTRDPWSSLAKMIAGCENKGFPGVRNDNVHLLLDPEALYARYACALREQTGIPMQFPLVEPKDFKWQKGLPWFMAANIERFPYLDPEFLSCQ